MSAIGRSAVFAPLEEKVDVVVCLVATVGFVCKFDYLIHVLIELCLAHVLIELRLIRTIRKCSFVC